MKKSELLQIGLEHLQTFRSGLELFGIEEELYMLFNKTGEDNYEVNNVSEEKFIKFQKGNENSNNQGHSLLTSDVNGQEVQTSKLGEEAVK